MPDLTDVSDVPAAEAKPKRKPSRKGKRPSPAPEAGAKPPEPTDPEKFEAVVAEWERYAADYAEDVRANALDLIPVNRAAEQVELLVRLAKESGNAKDGDRQRLRDIDREWREFRVFNAKDINAGRKVPMASGKLVRTVRFLAALVRGEAPAPEPTFVAEPPRPAAGPRPGVVTVGARWGE